MEPNVPPSWGGDVISVGPNILRGSAVNHDVSHTFLIKKLVSPELGNFFRGGAQDTYRPLPPGGDGEALAPF